MSAQSRVLLFVGFSRARNLLMRNNTPIRKGSKACVYFGATSNIVVHIVNDTDYEQEDIKHKTYGHEDYLK